MLSQGDQIVYSYILVPTTVEGDVNGAWISEILTAVNMYRNIFTVSAHRKHDISISVEVPAEQLSELFAREQNTGVVWTPQYFTPCKQPWYAGYGILLNF